MADLVTRLLLNSSNFDNNLRKSAQQVQQFQRVGKSLGSVVSTLGKFAGVVGVAMTAQEAFNGVIRGSQTASDTYDQVMRSVNTTLDTFFYTISTGDFTAFNMGLSRMIDKARDAQKALDKLGNATMSYGYFDSKYSAELEDAINKAKDLRLSNEDRDQAKKTAESIIGKQEEITKELQKSINNALSNVLTEGTALDPSIVGKVDLEDILLLDITAQGEENKKKLEQQYKEYQEKYKDVIDKNKVTVTSRPLPMIGLPVYNRVDQDQIEEEIKPIAEEYKQAILYNEVLVKKGDDWLQNTIKMAQQLDSSNRKLTEMKNKMLELTNQDVTKNQQNDKPTKIEELPKGSLAELDKLIGQKRTELSLAISNEDRIKINKELEELTEKRRIIEFQYKYSTSPNGQASGTSLAQKMPDMKGIKIENPIKRQDLQLNTDYVDSLNAIANVMGAVTNMTNEGAAAWLSWSANLLNAIAAAIPAIQTMITAKTAEAAASGAAEAAKTPFVGWLMVGGAIASILAAFAALPSFSTGGIFAGNSTVGDMNLARVNAGEMILNNRQQRNLFNLLNSNGSISSGGGQVEFKIKGSELYGVLNNYNTKRNKVR